MTCDCIKNRETKGYVFRLNQQSKNGITIFNIKNRWITDFVYKEEPPTGPYASISILGYGIALAWGWKE